MRRGSAILLLLLAGGLVRLGAQAAPPAGAQPVTVDGARLGPVPEVLYAHLPAVPRGQGVVVEDIQAGSPLREAGLRRNDVLLRLDGVGLRSPKHFSDLLARAKPGQPHRLVLLRAGKQMSLALAPPGDEPEPVPKAVLKPGGPPAVDVSYERLAGGKLKVRFEYLSPAGKLQQVTCSGSLSQIQSRVRQEKSMPAPVQDLVEVALRRLQVSTNTEAR
jgi:hypothetical protein